MEKKFRAIACAALNLPEAAFDEELIAAFAKMQLEAKEVLLSAELDHRLKAIEETSVQQRSDAIIA